MLAESNPKNVCTISSSLQCCIDTIAHKYGTG